MHFRTVYPFWRTQMRNSHYFGHTVGAKVTELRRGSVNSVSIGCVDRNRIDGSIALRSSCRVIGKPAKALAATLSERHRQLGGPCRGCANGSGWVVG